MNINPYLISVDEIERFQADAPGEDFGVSADIPWAVDYEVTLGDQNTKDAYDASSPIKKIAVKFSSTHAPADGRLGYTFFWTVCSSTYKDSPNSRNHEKGDLKKALIQDKFDEQSAKAWLAQKIGSIGTQDSHTLSEKFSEFLDTNDWDEDDDR